ncbi:conserved Plasmodium protein, unknown function [Plasmodium chabaudi chabaudi]|uniref:Uncharacterized protein n=1 Tax=Plasmodium chabaudi chabaudi TaxID=31271 RepID=A0A1D3S071_PLACU|nr:conserved Plasmodium protein, unknown function [Plasmodium chabaudi chabaudi]
MVLKDKKKKLQSLRYLKKKNKNANANRYPEREANSKETKQNDSDENKQNYLDDDDLPSYNSNDDALIKDKDQFSYILNSDEEPYEIKEENQINISNKNKQKEFHINFVLTSVALNIPPGMV